MWIICKHLWKVLTGRGIVRNINQLKLFLTHPQDWLPHIRLIRLRSTLRPLCMAYVSIDDLELGHAVAPDWYFKRRFDALVSASGVSLLSSAELNKLCPSDGPIEVYKKKVFNGNGRVAALKAVGFKGHIEVLIKVKRAS